MRAAQHANRAHPPRNIGRLKKGKRAVYASETQPPALAYQFIRGTSGNQAKERATPTNRAETLESERRGVEA